MNISVIKGIVRDLVGKEVNVKEYVGRNKYEKYNAIVYQMYPNLFVLKSKNDLINYQKCDLEKNLEFFNCLTFLLKEFIMKLTYSIRRNIDENYSC